jgi:hypothetical protein
MPVTLPSNAGANKAKANGKGRMALERQPAGQGKARDFNDNARDYRKSPY